MVANEIMAQNNNTKYPNVVIMGNTIVKSSNDNSSGGGNGESSVVVVDNLNSTSPTDALSANMGRALDQRINTLDVNNTIGILSITHGGTNADNLADAQANLGIQQVVHDYTTSQDFDSLTSTGIHTVRGSNTNSPVPTSGGCLIVSTSSNDYITQQFMTNANQPRLFYRSRGTAATTWSDWIEVPNSSTISTTITNHNTAADAHTDIRTILNTKVDSSYVDAQIANITINWADAISQDNGNALSLGDDGKLML